MVCVVCMCGPVCAHRKHLCLWSGGGEIVQFSSYQEACRIGAITSHCWAINVKLIAFQREKKRVGGGGQSVCISSFMPPVLLQLLSGAFWPVPQMHYTCIIICSRETSQFSQKPQLCFLCLVHGWSDYMLISCQSSKWRYLAVTQQLFHLTCLLYRFINLLIINNLQ